MLHFLPSLHGDIHKHFNMPLGPHLPFLTYAVTTDLVGIEFVCHLVSETLIYILEFLKKCIDMNRNSD